MFLLYTVEENLVIAKAIMDKHTADAQAVLAHRASEAQAAFAHATAEAQIVVGQRLQAARLYCEEAGEVLKKRLVLLPNY